MREVPIGNSYQRRTSILMETSLSAASQTRFLPHPKSMLDRFVHKQGLGFSPYSLEQPLSPSLGRIRPGARPISRFGSFHCK